MAEAFSLFNHGENEETVRQWLNVHIPLSLRRIRKTLRFFSETFGLTGSLLHLTDLALCGPLDFT
ncbi:MAG: hypothetical protein ACLQGP_10285, partial [Isosphaeraceae bacterium]